MLESQEREHQRIAAELPDSLGQSLLIIKTRAFLAQESLTGHDDALEQMEEIFAASAHAIEEVREIACNLRPYQIENFGLTKTIRGMCQQAERTSGIRFTAELQNIDGLFSKEAELYVYRIVQESVNNILKHSPASEAKLKLERAGREARLCIADNGRGFAIADRGVRIADSSANAVLSTANPHSGGFGLIGLAERVRMLKGMLAIETSDGKGTAITISLPIQEESRLNETNGHH